MTSSALALSAAPPAVFDCKGTAIRVEYRDVQQGVARSAVITLPSGTTLALPIASSGSGARYSDGKASFWEHQGTATFKTSSGTWTDCPLRR